MKLAEFERSTDRAFSFLCVDHAYHALPAEIGGHFGGLIRRFVRGTCEIAVMYGDMDSEHLCSIWFRDDIHQSVAERSYTAPALATLLSSRCPAFVHPTWDALSKGATAEAVLTEYARLLKAHAMDVIQGDFSAFPTLVYVVHHVDRQFPGGTVRRFLGVYSSYELATAAIEDRRLKRGFVERQDGFEIAKLALDGYGFWFAGIPLNDGREDRG